MIHDCVMDVLWMPVKRVKRDHWYYFRYITITKCTRCCQYMFFLMYTVQFSVYCMYNIYFGSLLNIFAFNIFKVFVILQYAEFPKHRFIYRIFKFVALPFFWSLSLNFILVSASQHRSKTGCSKPIHEPSFLSFNGGPWHFQIHPSPPRNFPRKLLTPGPGRSSVQISTWNTGGRGLFAEPQRLG